jgi:signal transduction histidine kinase
LTGRLDTHIQLHSQADAFVRTSADRLAQVFENLLDSASSFAPAGSVVDLSVRVDGPTCIIRIEGCGPGFPSAHIERVFDRVFSYRPDGGRREHTGLGLSIARAIVEGYGGAIAAENRPGGGAAVEVRLTRVAAVQPSSRPVQIASRTEPV